MKTIVAKDYEELSAKCAQILIERIKAHPTITLGLATGSTPIGTYENLIEAHREGLDFSSVTTYNLDEYVGLSAQDDHSYHRFMKIHLFNHINISPENTHFPTDYTRPESYDDIIEQTGGIDLQLLGVGSNGHLAFNEPAEHLNYPTSEVLLTSSTIHANARFFDSEDEVPTKAISMGLGTIFKAR